MHNPLSPGIDVACTSRRDRRKPRALTQLAARHHPPALNENWKHAI